MGKAVDLYGYEICSAQDLNKRCYSVAQSILSTQTVVAITLMLDWHVRVSWIYTFTHVLYVTLRM